MSTSQKGIPLFQARVALREARNHLNLAIEKYEGGSDDLSSSLTHWKMELPLEPPEGMFDLKAVEVGVVQKNSAAAASGASPTQQMFPWFRGCSVGRTWNK